MRSTVPLGCPRCEGRRTDMVAHLRALAVVGVAASVSIIAWTSRRRARHDAAVDDVAEREAAAATKVAAAVRGRHARRARATARARGAARVCFFEIAGRLPGSILVRRHRAKLPLAQDASSRAPPRLGHVFAKPDAKRAVSSIGQRERLLTDWCSAAH